MLVSQRAPAAAAAVAVDPVRVITGVLSNLLRSFLDPLAASNAPGAPADTPTLWSLLAFARREFETAFASPSQTNTPVNVQTTSQALAANTQPSGQQGVQPEQRTLVLTALPAEADAILARTTLDPNPTVVVNGHHFYLGSIDGKKVIVAMTGIGMVNATQTTETALDHFTPASGISIDAMVFSGVAGGSGRTEIGDVAVPARWTSDGGATWHAVDTSMLAAANTLNVELDSTDSIGDPACHLCGPLARFPLIDLNREPQLFVGGDGSTADNNNGTAFPEIPFGGAIFRPPALCRTGFLASIHRQLLPGAGTLPGPRTRQQHHGVLCDRESARRCGRPGDRGGPTGCRCARHPVPRHPRHVRRARRPAAPAGLPIHVFGLQANCSGQCRHRHRGRPK